MKKIFASAQSYNSHMAISRIKKEEITAKLEKIIKNSSSLVFLNFHGLGVSDTTLMRRNLRENGVRYLVSKKTLANRVLAEAPFAGDIPAFEGELAIAYGDDSLAPAREVLFFQNKHKKNLAIIGGVFDGMFRNKEDMMEIASIPPLQTLRGQFVNLINSPIQSFVGALDEIAKARA
jgi:large subunit ribosomal protein L10